MEPKFPYALHAKSLQSSPTLCNPMDYSPPGSSVHGIFQARILEWVAISFSRRSSQPRHQTHILMSPALAIGFFTTSTTCTSVDICAVYRDRKQVKHLVILIKLSLSGKTSHKIYHVNPFKKFVLTLRWHSILETAVCSLHLNLALSCTSFAGC